MKWWYSMKRRRVQSRAPKIPKRHFRAAPAAATFFLRETLKKGGRLPKTCGVPWRGFWTGGTHFFVFVLVLILIFVLKESEANNYVRLLKKGESIPFSKMGSGNSLVSKKTGGAFLISKKEGKDFFDTRNPYNPVNSVGPKWLKKVALTTIIVCFSL